MSSEDEGTENLGLVFRQAAQRDRKYIYANKTLPVHVPKDEVDDVIVEVRRSRIVRARELAEELRSDASDWGDLALATGSAGVGGIIGGAASKLDLSTPFNAAYYLACVAIAISGLVFTFTARHYRRRGSADIAAEILRTLPDQLIKSR